MKRYIILLVSILYFISAVAQKKKVGFYKPAPAQYVPVNDFAGLLTTAQIDLLAQQMQQYRDTSGHVLVIITHTNLTDAITGEDNSIEEAALHYFNKWKIGDKNRNDGVLILVAKQERKVRIATGKGIDDVLTDGICQSIIDNDIVPRFKEKRYYEGLMAAVQSIEQTLSPRAETAAAAIEKEVVRDIVPYSQEEDNTANYTGLVLIVLFVGSVVWMIIKARKRNSEVIDSNGSNTVNGNWFNNYLPGRNWFWGSGNSYHHHNNYYDNNNNGFSSFSSNDSYSSSGGNDSSDSSYGGGSSNGGGAGGSW